MLLTEIEPEKQVEPSQIQWGIQAIKDDKSKVWTSSPESDGPWLSKEDASKQMSSILDLIDTDEYEWAGSIIQVVKVEA